MELRKLDESTRKNECRGRNGMMGGSCVWLRQGGSVERGVVAVVGVVGCLLRGCRGGAFSQVVGTGTLLSKNARCLPPFASGADFSATLDRDDYSRAKAGPESKWANAVKGASSPPAVDCRDSEVRGAAAIVVAGGRRRDGLTGCGVL